MRCLSGREGAIPQAVRGRTSNEMALPPKREKRTVRRISKTIVFVKEKIQVYSF
jgi:hypothetical protein